MRNIAITLSYNGKNYAGYQIQKNANTIMAELQKAIEKVMGEKTDVKGCSRTDSKVHAKGYVLNFKTNSTIPAERVPLALNMYLPEDIAVLHAAEVSEEFHARYSSIGKEYIYKVYTGRYRDPFMADFTCHYPHKIDVTQLNDCAQIFVGTHDFLSFTGKKNTQENTVRTVSSFDVTQQGDTITFTVRGDGFLYNMVRILVGTLLGVAEGRFSKDSLGEVLKAKNRECAGKTAPPQGLYLNKVFYGEEYSQYFPGQS